MPASSAWNLRRAVHVLRAGGVVAYPTEGVYGLGCDPFNERAILRLLAIKSRALDKGLIVIAANAEQHTALQAATERGRALRILLYLFERDAAVRYLRSG